MHHFPFLRAIQGFQFLHILINFFFFFYISEPNGCEVVSHCGFDFHFSFHFQAHVFSFQRGLPFVGVRVEKREYKEILKPWLDKLRWLECFPDSPRLQFRFLVRKSTSEFINGWNNKLMIISPLYPQLPALQRVLSINFKN